MVPFDSACQIGLSTIRRDLLTIDQGVCRWRFKNCDFGNFFDYWRRTRQHTGKRTPAFDSANWIAVSTLLKEDLIPDQDVCRWRFKNCEIWYVFDCWRRTRQDTVKRTAPFDSAHQIGISTLLTDILTIDSGFTGWRFKNWEICYVSNYYERTDRDTDKRIIPLDSAHQIGLEIILNWILTALRKCSPGSLPYLEILGGVF